MTKKKDEGNKTEEAIGLRREIGLISAISLICSVMIGSGIFVSPSRVLEKTGSVGLCLIVWSISGLISYFGALSFAELGILVPDSGAEYAFLRAAFRERHRYLGPLPSFIYAWVMVFLVRPAEVAILVLTSSEYFYQASSYYLHLSLPSHVQAQVKTIISLLAISLISYINYSSVKCYIRLINMFSFLKVIACLLIIGGGSYHLITGNTCNISRGFEGSKTNLKDLVLAFYTGLWSFDGWSSVTVVSEEIKKPARNIPLSISIGVPLITFLYVMMNVSYLSALSTQEMVRASAVAMVFAEKLFGSYAFVIPIAVVLATFSCAMSVQFGVSRLCYSASRHGQMVECCGYIHVRKLTPAVAVLLQGTLSGLFIVTGNIKELIEFVSFMIWIFYCLAFVSLLILKKSRGDVTNPYRVPVLIPMTLIVMTAFFGVVPLVLKPDLLYLGGMAFILAGILAYHVFIYKAVRPSLINRMTFLAQVLMEVVPPSSS